MRLNENDTKARKGSRPRKIEQHISLTNREIMADLMYPAPVRASRERRGNR